MSKKHEVLKRCIQEKTMTVDDFFTIISIMKGHWKDRQNGAYAFEYMNLNPVSMTLGLALKGCLAQVSMYDDVFIQAIELGLPPEIPMLVYVNDGHGNKSEIEYFCRHGWLENTPQHGCDGTLVMELREKLKVAMGIRSMIRPDRSSPRITVR